MLRSKSAGTGRSFLDDLLGNDSSDADVPLSSNRQRKSVRFFDEDIEANTASPSRPHSSTLDSLLNSDKNETNSVRPSSSATELRSGGSSKADWLGISNDDDEPVKVQAKSKSSPLSTSSSEPDWITASLRARQTARTTTEAKKPTFLESKTETQSFVESQSKPSATETLKKTSSLDQIDSPKVSPSIKPSTETAIVPETVKTQTVKSKTEEPIQIDIDKVDIGLETASSATQSVAFLQTKVSLQIKNLKLKVF